MRGVWSDLCLSFRLLRKSAGFSATGVLSLAVASSPLVAAQLFEVSPFDIAIWGGASLTLVVIAAVAGYIPARRAAAIDPNTALRA